MRSRLRFTPSGKGGIGLGLGIVLGMAAPALAAVCNVPSAAYPTIQSAADDMTCTEIVLAAGTFTEQVTIGRPGSIFLHGAGAGRTIIRSPATRMPSTLPTTYYPNYTYVIQVPPGLGADIADLTVDGGGNSFCGEPYFAVRFNNAAGSLDSVVVEHVRSPGADFGCQNTISIASTGEAGGGSSLTVIRSTVRDFQKVAILVNGATANAALFSNVIHGVGAQPYTAQNGIQVSRGASATARNNIIDAIHYIGDTCLPTPMGSVTQVGAGILTYQAGAVTLIQNVVLDVDRGIDLDENTGSQTVNQNRVNDSYSGIVSENNAAGTVLLSQNAVLRSVPSPAINAGTCFTDSGNGFTVIGESGTTLQINAGADEAQNGIELRPDTSGVTVSENQLTRSGGVDIKDAGMGNMVTLNTCRTSSPNGLCTYAP